MSKSLSIAAACVLGCLALRLGAAAAEPAHGGSPMRGRTKQGRVIRLALERRSVQA